MVGLVTQGTAGGSCCRGALGYRLTLLPGSIRKKRPLTNVYFHISTSTEEGQSFPLSRPRASREAALETGLKTPQAESVSLGMCGRIEARLIWRFVFSKRI